MAFLRCFLVAIAVLGAACEGGRSGDATGSDGAIIDTIEGADSGTADASTFLDAKTDPGADGSPGTQEGNDDDGADSMPAEPADGVTPADTSTADGEQPEPGDAIERPDAQPEPSPDIEAADAALPTGCFLGESDCNPLTNEGCTEAGHACDLGYDNGVASLVCFPPPNLQGLGESCSNSSGPFCQPTLHCGWDDTCRPFCCFADACNAATGEVCVKADVHGGGTLGYCAPEPPDCGLPGAACAQPSDCCSGDCHSDHCH
jgi:hypothetical protein